MRRLIAALVTIAVLIGGAFSPARAATSQVVDVTAKLNTNCMIPTPVLAYGQCGIDDGYGYWQAETVPAAGAQVTVYNTTFAWPAHGLLKKDGWITAGETFPLPPVKGFKSLAMLATQGTLVGGPPKTPTALDFTVNYTDGSKVSQQLSVLNWRCPGSKSAVKGVKAQYLQPTNVVDGCVDFVRLALNAKKTVKSVVLPPKVARFMVVSMSFTQTVSKPASGPVFN